MRYAFSYRRAYDKLYPDKRSKFVEELRKEKGDRLLFYSVADSRFCAGCDRERDSGESDPDLFLCRRCVAVREDKKEEEEGKGGVKSGNRQGVFSLLGGSNL